MEEQLKNARRSKLIALDIDGTLTDDRKQVPPRTRERLIRLEEQGLRLALASARPTPGLFALRDELRMPEFQGILMAYNGGHITDTEGRTLAETRIPEETARALLHFLKTLPVTVILDDGRQFYVEDENGYKVEYECRNNRMRCSAEPDLAEFLHFAPVKLLLSVLPEAILAVQQQIAAALPEELTVVRTAAFYLEIIPRSIDKGRGLREICRALGIAPEETLAFGDSENDIPLLQAAGIGIAMGNAEEAVKQAADLVTLSNNEEGIAAALDLLGLTGGEDAV